MAALARRGNSPELFKKGKTHKLSLIVFRVAYSLIRMLALIFIPEIQLKLGQYSQIFSKM